MAQYLYCFLKLTMLFSILSGHANNIHCLAKAINALAGALFTIHGPGDVEERLKEFLAVSSIHFLRWYLMVLTSLITRFICSVNLSNIINCVPFFFSLLRRVCFVWVRKLKKKQ